MRYLQQILWIHKWLNQKPHADMMDNAASGSSHCDLMLLSFHFHMWPAHEEKARTCHRRTQNRINTTLTKGFYIRSCSSHNTDTRICSTPPKHVSCLILPVLVEPLKSLLHSTTSGQKPTNNRSVIIIVPLSGGKMSNKSKVQMTFSTETHSPYSVLHISAALLWTLEVSHRGYE